MQLNFKKVDSSSGNTNAGDILFVNNDNGIYIVESDGSKTKYGGSEYTLFNKLSADFIKDGSTNKVVTETEKTGWNDKQPGNFIVIAGENIDGQDNAKTTNYSVSDVQDAVVTGKNVLLKWGALSLPLVFISSEFAIYCLTVAADSSLSSNMPTCVLTVVQRNNTATYTEYDFNSVAFTGETDPVFTASAAYGITATDITNWNNKVSNVQADWNATSGDAVILNKPDIVTDKLGNFDYLNIGTGTNTIYTSINAHGSVEISDGNNSIKLDSGGDNGINITANDGADGTIRLTASNNIYLDTSGTNKAYYNNKEIATKNDIPSAVTESTVSGWGFTKNAGTVTGITMNGTSKGTSGNINLGTVITAETQPDWNVTDTSSAAYIKNKPTIPSTLDQVIDGSTRKLSNYLPLTGGVMSSDANATIDWNISTEGSGTRIDYYGIGFGSKDYEKAYLHINKLNLTDTAGDNEHGGIYVDDKLYGFFNDTTYTFPNSSGTLALVSNIPGDVSISNWGYLKANDVSTKADKSAVISSLSLNMDSSTYTVTLSGTMADGSTFTVSNPIDLPLESMVVNGSYNNSTKKVVLTLKNGSTVEFSVADLVAGLQSEITTSNKLTSDLIVEADPIFTASAAYGITSANITTWNNKQNALTWDTAPTENSTNPVTSGGLYTVITANELVTSTALNDLDSRVSTLEENSGSGGITTETDPVFTASAAYGISASDITNWNNKVSNVQSDWNATTGAAVILNKPAIPTQTTDASISGWGYIKTITDASIAALGYTKNTGTLTGVKFNGTDASITNGVAAISETDPVFSASAAAGITASDITNWNEKTSNTGTITGITMNGASKGTSGVVNLGTVITSHAKHKLTTTNGTATAGGSTITYVESLTGTTTATDGDLSLTATRKSVTIPNEVTESTVSGWGFTKNTGTLTTETDPVFSASAAADITSSNITTWNGKQDAISDLATIRSNASAGAAKVSANNSTITIQKNGTTVDSFTTNASSAKTINMTVNELPTVSGSDNGKILQVVNGQWALVTPVSIYNGSGEPSNILGNNGDIYIQS